MRGLRHQLVLFAAVALAGSWQSASAQPAAPVGPAPLTPSQKPVTSPYLNLARDTGFAGPAFQYYRRVRPEMEFRSANARQGGQIRSLQEQFAQQREMLQSPDSTLSPTGHRTLFMNYGPYFSSGGPRGRR